MAEVTWTAEAQRWLKDIFEYISTDNPQAAVQTVNGSGHADDERQAETIPIAEVGEALITGEVLEDYP
jgi:plasmid stabilization system protein ParE